MKLNDKDLRKAFKSQVVPPPDTKRREETQRKAKELFTQQKARKEKKSKGSELLKRLMGKLINLLIPPKGAPVMMPKKYQFVLVAALLLGVVVFVGPSYLDFSSKEDVQQAQQSLDTTTEPNQPPSTVDNRASGSDADTEMVAAKPPAVSPPLQERLQKGTQAPAEDKLTVASPTPGKSIHPSAAPSAPQRRSEQARVTMSRTKNGHDNKAMFGYVAPEPVDHSYKDIGRDQFEKTTPNRVKLVSEEPVSTFSIDVDTASYSFMRRQLNSGVLPQKNAVRVEELLNYFDYDYPLPVDKSRPFEPSVAVYPSPWNTKTKLLHIGIKGYDIEPAEKPRSNLVFLLDVSGSMNSPDKLPLLKNSFRLLVNTLSPEDTVAIAVYAGAAGTILEPTALKEKGKILAALDQLSAGGSTAGGEGIKLAYSLAKANFSKEAVNRVILATDGDFNVGITNQEELKSYIERQRDSGIFLSVLGFGQGNYNDALMQILAQNGNGNGAYIDSLSEARKVLVEEASSTLFTIAKDVKIQMEFNPAMVTDYRLIGYETRLLNREDFNNDQVDAGEVGSGHTVTAIYEFTPVSGEPGVIDELRYAAPVEPKKATTSTEYAFLKIRYKLPHSDTSTLITTPINREVEYSEFGAVPDEMRFAAAVAGFGQVLRGDPYLKNFSYDQIITIGRQARGDDEFGYRTEFINLVRLAESAADL